MTAHRFTVAQRKRALEQRLRTAGLTKARAVDVASRAWRFWWAPPLLVVWIARWTAR